CSSPLPPPPNSTLFPYTTLFRSSVSSDSPRKILPTACSAKQTWQSCRALPLATIVPFVSATRPASTSSKKASIGCRISVEHSDRSEEHTSELQSQSNLVCRLLLE